MADTSTQMPQNSRTVGRVVAIARKEFHTGIRSDALQIIFGLLLTATVLVYWASSRSADPTVLSAIGILGLPFQLLIPVAAITLGTSSIAGERATGSLKMLLGLPPSRTEVVVGTFIGATGVVLAGLGATFVIAAVLAVAFFGTLAVGPLVSVVSAAFLLGMAFLGFSVGLSAAASTTKRAMTAGFGGFLGLTFLWEPILAGVYYLVTGSGPSGDLPGWVLLIDQMNPIEAYAVVANMAGDVGVTPLRISIGLGGRSAAVEWASTAIPAVLLEPLSVGVLCCWVILPLGAGTYWFQRSDLT